MSDTPAGRVCPRCGSEHGRGENIRRAFLHYEPAPNDAQEETEWVDEIPMLLHALVCTECGFVLGVFDKTRLDEAALPRRSDAFRVDEELR